MEFKRIVAPTDFSSFSEVGVRAAGELALKLGTRLTLLHVVTESELEALATAHVPRHPVDLIHQDMEAALMDQYRRVVPAEVRRDLPVEPVVAVGTPSVEILRMARLKGADLLVMGTHGRTGLARMVMGSVTEQVLRRAPCPVLAVRPAEVVAEALAEAKSPE
jgi:nucleotide-binding universal stress UspA family protein